MTEIARYTAYYGNYNYAYIIGWDLLRQDTAGNYSVIRLYAQIQVNGANGINWSNGSAVLQGSSFGLATYYGRGTTTVYQKDVTVYHNNEGYLTYNVSGSINTTFLMNGSCNGNITLPRILRYATITGANNFTDEENPTIQFSNPAGFPLTLKMEAGGDVELITRKRINASSPYTFVLTNEERKKLLQKCKNSNSMSVRFTVVTVINGNDSNWSYTDRKMTIINANPTVNEWSYEDGNTNLLSLTGSNQKFIKGHSNLKVTIDTKATALKEASISKYRLTVGADYKEENERENTVTLLLSQIKSKSLELSAYDSRGNIASNSKEIVNFLDYESPKITNLQVDREEGGVSTQVKLSFSGTFWNNSFGLQTNSINVSYKYKSTGASEWITGQTTLTPEIDGNTFNGETLIMGDLEAVGFDLDSNFDFKLIAVDKLETIENQVLLSAGSPAVDIYKNNISVGGIYDEYKGGRVQISGIPLIDYIYPVGSIYFSVENINPSTWLGGTWESWGNGRVPVGVDVSQTEFNETEKTGGEKTHKLTVSEMPTHRHKLKITNNNMNGTVGFLRVGDWSENGQTTWTEHSEGGDHPHNNLQPYITCYMWKRIE